MKETAESIMQQVRSKYANCKSYEDLGLAITTGNRFCERTKFKTTFLSPNYFCFEWQKLTVGSEASQKCGIWSNGEHTRTRVQKLKIAPSLAVGVASVNGASQGAAHLMASLLILKVRIESIVDEFAGLELINAPDAGQSYILAGRNRSFWIDKSDFSIRKFENNPWPDATKDDLAARETELAKKLNRPALESDISLWTIEYNFDHISFQKDLNPSDFGLPWLES